MPVFETPGGSRMDISLPQVEWPELKDAIDTYMSLKRELRATQARKMSLETDLRKAENAAIAAVKDAIRDGKGEKEAVAKFDKDIEKIQREIAACGRRSKAIDEGLDDAESELILSVDEHRDEWLGEVAPQVEAALDAYREAVEGLVAKREALSRLYALRGWLRGFPEAPVTFKIGVGILPKLRNMNGSPYRLHEVVAALRDDATPEPQMEELEPFAPLDPRLVTEFK